MYCFSFARVVHFCLSTKLCESGMEYDASIEWWKFLPGSCENIVPTKREQRNHSSWSEHSVA